VIIDGTKIPNKVPKPHAAPRVTFRTYKNRNTAKVLVVVTLCGLINFVSDAYEGSASDRQIIEKSMLPEKLKPSDSVMADYTLYRKHWVCESNGKVGLPP